VTFRYKAAGAPLYDGFSLKIAPGERVALVGPTGSGKSTFVKLVQRLHDLQGGRIVIDGQDVSAVTQGSLRRAIAVVPQDPALFHRSLLENIAYGKPDATRAEIEDGGPQGPRPRLHPAPAQGLRHPGRRARRQAVGRRAPARGHRPRLPGRRADPGSGRGDLVAGRRDRGPGPGSPPRP
jgi:ABC-type branched-subunit amino acid transport system ATPase component